MAIFHVRMRYDTNRRCCTLYSPIKKFPGSLQLRENEERKEQAVETVTVASETTMAKLCQVETLIVLVFQYIGLVWDFKEGSFSGIKKIQSSDGLVWIRFYTILTTVCFVLC
jgi:hypothetical protein